MLTFFLRILAVCFNTGNLIFKHPIVFSTKILPLESFLLNFRIYSLLKFHSIPFRVTHRSHKRALWWLKLHPSKKTCKGAHNILYNMETRNQDNQNPNKLNHKRGILASTHRINPFHTLSEF